MLAPVVQLSVASTLVVVCDVRSEPASMLQELVALSANGVPKTTALTYSIEKALAEVTEKLEQRQLHENLRSDLDAALESQEVVA